MVNIKVTVTGSWESVFNPPFAYIDRLIGKLDKQQEEYWKNRKPPTPMEVGMDPVDKVKLFKIFVGILVIIRYLYFYLVTGIFRFVCFLRTLFQI